MIEELCARLKEKRKELGYTLEEVVEKTKLHPSVIRNIEQGNLEKINPTYLKGFIKIYASFLGIDLDKNILKEITPPKEIKKEPIRRRQTTFNFNVKKIRKYFILFLLIAIIFTSGLLISKLIKNIFSSKERKIEEKTTSVFSPSNITSEMIVSVVAKRNCFLKVKVDGELLFEGILRKGVVETWKGKKEIEFRISDGSAVYIEVNGKRLPPLTSMRRPIKSLKITPTGISVEK
jgi:cytoskeletal protein RodZ